MLILFNQTNHNTSHKTKMRGFMDKKESTKKAAMERWHSTVPKSTHEGLLNIGGQIIECDVLPDGRRVLRQKTLAKAMGRARSNKNDLERSKQLKIPSFVVSNNLTPYLGQEILERGEPIIYKSKEGRKLVGYEARILPEVCKVYVKADDANALQSQQKQIACVCRAILYSLASVGIIALVDEATGYQETRARDELQELLKIYISEELMPWTKRFPNEFFKQLYRIYGWKYPKDKNHPQCVANFIIKYVYKKLPDGVYKALKSINPSNVNGNRQHRHHQFLTDDVGHDTLNKQLVQTVTVMKLSKDIVDFDKKMDELSINED